MDPGVRRGDGIGKSLNALLTRLGLILSASVRGGGGVVGRHSIAPPPLPHPERASTGHAVPAVPERVAGAGRDVTG